jgi:hypothetical protein
MRRLILYLIFLLIPFVDNARVVASNTNNSASAINMELYTAVKLADLGLDKAIFELAIKGLNKLVSAGKLLNSTIVTIVDFSQSSNKKRLYVIDLKNKRMLFNTYVAHGRNTGLEFAKNFSNEEGSFKSSLGFYVTAHPITGSHTGFSLLMEGVEKGIQKNGRLGRSMGCPTLPPELNKPIIETIKDGTCLFIYNPDSKYLAGSRLIN